LEIQLNNDNEPFKFLEKAFEEISQKFEGKTPLPMVKRITDLLHYYREVRNDDVFPAYIIFDHGEKTFEVWLPEILDKNVPYKVKDVLGRYLNFLVTNYGMTHQYKAVDIDFSRSQNYMPGKPHPWEEVMKESKENLGVYIFETYLTNCGSDILETSYAREEYLNVIEQRKMTVPYLLFSDEAVDCILDKYILGIDIGGTSIKLQFFQIQKGKGHCCISEPLCHNSPNTNNQGRLSLNPLSNSYNIPTSRTNKKFKDANDFAKYIVDSLSEKLGNDEELLKKIISIGVCWPGPIRQNRISEISGILRNNFDGINPSIIKHNHNDIVAIDIGGALRTEFAKHNNDKMLTVALVNDGDAEAAGLTFGKVFHRAGEPENLNVKNFYKALFEKNAVAIIKAGTGTAGSVLINGMFVGLNEFGKVIVDLKATNTEKDKPKEERWPVGDANKFFSLSFLREELKKIEIKNSMEIEGRDIEFLKEIITSGKSEINDYYKKLFGAIELVKICQPDIEWNDIVTDSGGKLTINLDKLEQNPIKLSIDKELTLSDIYQIKKGDDYLLMKLGDNRISRLNLEEALQNTNKAVIENIGKNMGKRLADIVSLLYDIYDLKAVFISGGPVKGEVGKECIKLFSQEIQKYIYDRFHKDISFIKNLRDVENTLKPDEIEKTLEEFKLLYRHEYEKVSDNALLGTAIIGFDHFVTENKIRELQTFAKDPQEGKVSGWIGYLTEDELKQFIRLNSSRLKVTVGYNGEIKKLGSVPLQLI